LLFQHPLQQPQAHDIFQHPIAAFGAAFVGDIRLQRVARGVGVLLSKPISDQVPEERYAAFLLASGEAMTALAVSWLATATTGMALPCGHIQ
jgi:hypothetical protein